MALVQLMRLLVELLFGSRCCDAHLEGDSFTENVAMRTTEAQMNFMFLSITDGLLNCLDWYAKLDCFLSTNILRDRHVHHRDRESIDVCVALARVVHSEEGTLFPRPVRAVLNGDLLE